VEFHGTTSDLKRELVELSHVFNTLKEAECSDNTVLEHRMEEKLSSSVGKQFGDR
jgi:hypothetical protein